MIEDFNFDFLNPSKFMKNYKPEEKVDLAPYVLRIKRLEKQVNFLAKQCASLHTQFSSTNFFKNNSDYWIKQSEKETV